MKLGPGTVDTVLATPPLQRPPVPVKTVEHVVGVVASAGGLEAMLALFPLLKRNSRVAWVVAQHMGSASQSELVARLLARASALPVVLAQPLQPLQPDTIYLIPAGLDGVLEGGRLKLQPPGPQSISTPSGDALLASLATDFAGHCTAVVLSGAGRDGVEGARAIRMAQGQVLVQDPSTVKFSGMPSSVVHARVDNKVLSLEAMADWLNGWFESLHAMSLDFSAPPLLVEEGQIPSQWPELLDMVLKSTGVDFSGYKEDTLLRRLARHMGALQISHLRTYLEHCRRHPKEMHRLQRDFLVSFSVFFRDPQAFEAVRSAWAERLLRTPAEAPLKLWVPGCANGEEVYSLAMMLAELLGGPQHLQRVQLLGTDLNPNAIAAARVGHYRATALREVPTALLQRYFKPMGHVHEVLAAVRACCRFEVRNVFDGGPDEPVDMVSCRNMLIYLKPEQQAKLLALLHRALRSDGLLFVAPVETLGTQGDRWFVAVDRDQRLYRKRQPGQAATVFE